MTPPNPDDWTATAVEVAGIHPWNLTVADGVLRLCRKGLGSPAEVETIHPEDLETLIQRLWGLAGEPAEVGFRVRQPGGAWVRVEGRAKVIEVDDTGAPRRIVGCLRDESLAEPVEKALRESEARFRSFIANTRDAVWCYECVAPIPVNLPFHEQFERLLEARLVECNQVYASMRDAERPADLVGQRLVALSRSSIDVLRDLYGQMVASNFVLEDAVLGQRGPDGVLREVVARVHGIVEDGKLLRIWGSFADVTERRRSERRRAELEQQLRQVQKMDSLGTLAGGMAHDFNNVLVAIEGNAVLGLQEAKRAAADGIALHELETSLEEIVRAARHGATLTGRLLSLARRHETVRHEVRIEQVLTNVLPIVRRLIPSSIELDLEVQADAWVLGDVPQLEQALMNLLLNARDAVDEHGRIRVEVRAVEVTAEHLESRPWASAGRYVRIRVQDDGRGIAPELLERIFEPFFTTKAVGKGTGLGLAIVYGIVQQHGGFVTVSSVLGEGTRVDVSLPASAPASSTEQVVSHPTTTEPTAATVLIAEDEPAVRNVVKRVLVRGGFRVVEAADGDQAVAIFEAEPDRFDLALLDVVMPKRTGPQVFAALRRLRPALPVVFCSGYNGGALAPEILSDPRCRQLQKPFEPDALVAVLREILAGG